MASIDDLTDADSWTKASDDLLKQNTASQVNNSLYNAATVNADQAAGDSRMAKILNKPVQSVASYRDDAVRQAKLQTVNTDNLVANSPILAKFLGIQQNANIMHPDIEPAHAIEQTLSQWNPSTTDKISSWVRDTLGITSREQARAMNTYAANKIGISNDQASEVMGGMVPLDDPQIYSQMVGSAARTAAFDFLPNYAGAATTRGGQLGEGIGQLAGFTYGGPEIATKYLTSKLGISALNRVAGDSFAKVVGKTIASQAAHLGIAMPLSKLGDAFDAPDVASGAKILGNAAVSGVTTGAIFALAGSVLPSNTATQVLARMAGGSAAVDLQNGTNPMDDRPIEQKVFDYGLNAIFLAKGVGKTTGGWFHDAAKADIAVENNDKFTALSQLASSTKFRETAPDLFHSWVSDVSENGGLKDVYINGKTFAETLQQSGITPEALIQTLPDVAKQMVEAQETNGDVRISTADYATHIAPTDLGKALQPHLKTDPEAMTYQEAQAFYQTQGDALNAHAEKLATDNQDIQANKDDQQQVHDTILGQLNDTNRFPLDVNKQYAALARDHYTTRAEQLGIKPSELYEKYPLNVDSTFKDEEHLNQEGTKSNVLFEVAPDPNNKALSAKWDTLAQGDRHDISKEVATHILPDILKNEKTTGRMVTQIGGYEDKTNPTLNLKVDDPKKVIAVAKALGHALSQDSVVAHSDSKQRGMEKTGIVTLDLPKNLEPNAVHEVYSKLRELEQDGEKIIGGHSTADNQMVLYNFSKLSTEKFAEAIKTQIDTSELEGHYPINTDEAYLAFPQNGKDYNYGDINDNRSQGATSARQPSLEGSGRGDIRRRASDKLEELLSSDKYSGRDDGRAGGSDSDRAPSTEVRSLSTKRLTGLPESSQGPLSPIRDAAASYLKEAGLTSSPQTKYVKADPSRGARIADAFEKMLHEPADPETKASYEAMINETMAQYQTVKTLGLKIEFIKRGQSDPYAKGPTEALPDMASGHLWVFPTEIGFGSSEADVSNNPLLAKTDEYIDGQQLLANDVFRIVHDVFGHGKEGFGFGPTGEENAWQSHVRMYSDLAARAMTTETRGQNSWVNYGPKGEANHAAPKETIFADQKVGLLPEWVGKEGLENAQLNQDNRGSYAPASHSITLLKTADLTTFVHELGHHFLEMTSDIAKQKDAPQGIKDDFNKILNWFGVKDWNALSFEGKREYHEQFAEGFEKYMMEGKAPNLALQPVFSRIRAWFTHAYKSLVNLKVNLTPEVRGVFDRMLASENTIKEAEAARVFEPLFTEKPEGMADKDWQDYKDLGLEATQDAVSELESKSLRDMKWLSNAKSRILKGLQKEAEATRDRVMGEVQEEVLNSPLHKAQEMLAADPSIDKELVAEINGFGSAKEMTSAMDDAGSTRTQIDALTDTRMLQEHGELNSPRAIDEAASAAIHNEARARFMATGLKILTKSPIPVRLLLKGAKEAAEGAIEAKKVGDINPRLYEAAEAKANKEALRLAPKEPTEASLAQRAALLNNQLAKAARNAQTEIQKTLDYFKKLDKESIRAKIDVDIREQIDNLLERFDFRKNPTTGPTKQQVQLQQWADSQKELGYAPLEHPDIMNPAVRTPYKEMSMDQFRGLRDTIKSLETIGRERRTITIEGVKHDVKDFVQNDLIPKMIERGEKFTDAQIAERPRLGVDPLWRVTLDRVGSVLRSVKSEFTRTDYKANKYDLHALLGPFQKSIFERLINSAYKFGDSMDDIGKLKKQRTLEYGLDKEWQKSLDDVIGAHTLMDNSIEPPIPRRLTRSDLLGIAQHVGNESNFDKLVRGMDWKPEDVWQTLHDNMGAKDWNAVKTLGEMAGARWDEMVDMNRRLGNDSPAKIEPRPFPTKYGEMPGWYMPIDYDPIRSRLGKQKAEARALRPETAAFEGNYFRADTTTNGSLNARSSGYYDFINLDWRPVEKRISDSLRDLAFREALLDVRKLYINTNFANQFKRTYGPEEYTHMGDWIGRLVNAEVGDEKQSKLTAIMASSRRAMVANGVAFRISTVLKHGGSAGFKSGGYLVGGGEKYFAKRLAQMATNYPKEVSEGLAKFPELRQRVRQQDRDFSKSVTAIFKPESIHGKAERFGHAMVSSFDFMSALPTAHAAYDWAITEGIPKRLGGTGEPMSEADAISFANKTVREAHGSTNEASQSLLITNKSELIKNLTTLHGFMNNAFGQNADALDKLLHANGFGKPELLARTMMAQIVPGLLAGYISFGGPNEEETWLGWAFHHIGGEFAGMVPMARDAFNLLVEGRKSAGAMPWTRALSDGFKVFNDATQDGEAKHPIKDVGNVAGLLLPGLGQAGASTQYLYDVAKDKQPAETVSQWVHGLMTGKAETDK